MTAQKRFPSNPDGQPTTASACRSGPRSSLRGTKDAVCACGDPWSVLTLTAVDWAQLGTAFFTALAALAALGTVIRTEADRRDRQLPDFHIEALHDLRNQEARVTIVNYGGPARDVKVAGVEGEFGYFGLVGPTSYWRPGESRTIKLGMPPGQADEAKTIVICRDVRLRYLFARTVGGAGRRWPLRKAKEMADEDVFRHFFPRSPGPLDVPRTPVDMEIVDRAW